MFTRPCILHILFIYSFCALFVVFTLDSDKNNYGEFSLHVKEVELCKGPKRKDCCVISAKMSSDEVNLLYDIVIKKDVIPTRGKVVATINGQPLIRLQMKNPCDHLFMKPLFQALLNVTQQCVFVKGTYHLSINIENVAQKYYGGMFLYGNLTFKSMFYNDECNFSCTVIQVEFKPKKNKTSISKP